MPSPLISIITATYNRKDFIARAISSAQKQTYQNWEMIIADDASTDGTESLVKEYASRDARIQYILQEKNVGISQNRNTAIKASKGDLIAILDSDDEWLDTSKLASQVAYLEQHPLCGVVGTFAYKIDGNGEKMGVLEYKTENDAMKNAMLLKDQFCHSSVLMKKEALEKGYDESFKVCEDYDLFLRIGKTWEFGNIALPLTAYRVHGANISNRTKILAAKTHLLLVRKYHHDYPHSFRATIKGILRIIKSFV